MMASQFGLKYELFTFLCITVSMKKNQISFMIKIFAILLYFVTAVDLPYRHLNYSTWTSSSSCLPLSSRVETWVLEAFKSNVSTRIRAW